MYQYNENKFEELQKRLKLTRRQIRIDFGMANDITVRRWMTGEDAYISRIIQFCNLYNVSPLEFINKDGVGMNEVVGQENIISSPELATDIQKKISRNEKLLDYYEEELESKDKEIDRLRTLLSGQKLE